MQKLSHTAPYIAYAVATAGMAVLLLLGSSPGAIVARSYRAYNGRAVPGYTEYTYRDVNLSFSVPLSPVTAVEARAKKDGYILFAYPRCPYCRNLLPVLAAVATSEGVTMDYCQVDLYRDIYTYNSDTAAPVQTRPAGEGYTELLTWMTTWPSTPSPTRRKMKLMSGRSVSVHRPSSRWKMASPCQNGNYRMLQYL